MAVAFVSSLLARSDTAAGSVVVEETNYPPVPGQVELKGFEPEEERAVRGALRGKFTRRCTEAFHRAGLPSPLEVALAKGIVIRPARDLWKKEIGALGFVYDETRVRYQSEFSSGWAQGGTVPAERYGWALTVDGRARVFLYDSAFAGESYLFRRFDLEDVLTHELQHVCGKGKTPGRLGFLTHDLKGFEYHDYLLASCR